MRTFLFLGLLCVLGTATVALAQNDTSTFAVRVFGGTDTEAPTTPILQSATPVSSTQVTVTWSVATDNFVVSGYVLSRNGVPIATTTQTTYIDLGLTASTSYAYTVRAFDATPNYSSSSNSVVAVTLEEATESQTGGNQSTATKVSLDEISISTNHTTATLRVTTKRPARLAVKWGRTGAYELGYTVTEAFVQNYQTVITDLEPGTTYEYQVVAYNARGTETILRQGQFTTTETSQNQAPSNIASLRAVVDGEDVFLQWTGLDPLNRVRVVRSNLGFPQHIHDGAVIYEGVSNGFTDKDILKQFSPAYYTVFVIDATGAVSSGAVISAMKDGQSLPDPFEGEYPEEVLDSGVASTSEVTATETRFPSLSDIVIRQDGDRMTLDQTALTLRSGTTWYVSIPIETVFPSLKSIIISIQNPSNSKDVQSYLLRLNKDNTAYEAVIPPSAVVGRSRLSLAIYNYNTKIVATYQKSITFVDSGAQTEVVPIFPDRVFAAVATMSTVALPLLCAVLFFFFWRRRHRPLL